MIPRERVHRMLRFQSVDKPVLDCDINAVGIYEHGEKLRDLLRSLDSDFGPVSEKRFDLPKPEDFDQNDHYLVYSSDEWGVVWEQKIFGVMGHPYKRPLDDWSQLDNYKFPHQEPWTSEILEEKKIKIEALKNQGYFTRRGWIKYIELTYALRSFEDVLMDIALYDEDVLRFTDRLHAYNRLTVKNWIEAGTDCIQFADDLGTQKSLLISPQCFRNIYKPRLKELVDIVKKAGKYAFFHTCGYALPLLEDIKEIGFDGIWPQLNVYDLHELVHQCRELKLAISIHPERSKLMTTGKPEEIRKRIYEYNEIFRPEDGGAWYYLEIDNGFPYENIVSMVETIRELRT